MAQYDKDANAVSHDPQEFDIVQSPQPRRQPPWRRILDYVRKWHASPQFLGRQIQMMALSPHQFLNI